MGEVVICCVDGCDRPKSVRGMCRRHYESWRLRTDAGFRQRRAAALKAGLDRNPGRRARKNELGREYHARKAQDPSYKAQRAAYARRRNTGFTPDLTEFCRHMQDGCALCNRQLTPNTRGAASEHADHDHETGKPRGLLCGVCNQALGMYEKHQRPAGLRLDAYEAYLQSPPARRFLS